MISNQKRDKKIGIIGTLIFHICLLIAFLFLGLTYQDPPPAEEGISINFGFLDEGKEEINIEANSDNLEIIEEEIIEEQIEILEKPAIQNIIEAPELKQQKEEIEEVVKKEELKEEVIEEKKPEINIKALYPGKKKKIEASQGDNKNMGDQGIAEGDVNSTNYTNGGGIGNGENILLNGRSVEFKAKPIYEMQVEGIVFVSITVDRSGNVINATPGTKGSTTLNRQLLQRAKAAALKTKFNPKPSAPNNQKGTIIYHFTLN